MSILYPFTNKVLEELFLYIIYFKNLEMLKELKKIFTGIQYNCKLFLLKVYKDCY